MPRSRHGSSSSTIPQPAPVDPGRLIILFMVITLTVLTFFVKKVIPFNNIYGLFHCAISPAIDGHNICTEGFYCRLWTSTFVCSLAWWLASWAGLVPTVLTGMQWEFDGEGIMFTGGSKGSLSTGGDREGASSGSVNFLDMSSDSEEDCCAGCGVKMTAAEKVAFEKRTKVRNRAARRAEAKKEREIRAAKE